MPPATEENKRFWMRRPRRRDTMSQSTTDVQFTDTVMEDLIPRSSTADRTKSDWKPPKGTEHILPPRLEKKIFALAETSGNMKRMSVELDTHQKCVTNLAATVVRQNNQIRELKRHIKELVTLLETTNGSVPSCMETSLTDLSDSPCSSTSTPESQVSSPSEFSKEDDDRDTVLHIDKEESEYSQETGDGVTVTVMTVTTKAVNDDNSRHDRLCSPSTRQHPMPAATHVEIDCSSISE